MQQSFSKSESGAVAMVFGLLMIPLVAISALAVDGARAYFMDQKLRASLDAAALAGARALYNAGVTNADISDLTRKHLLTMMESEAGNGMLIDNVDVTVDNNNRRVQIDVESTVNTPLSSAVGFTFFKMNRTASAIYDQGNVELSLMLDVSGSMSGSKLSDLKNSVRDMVDIMLPDGESRDGIRLGVAPYASSVNAGDFSNLAKGNSGTNLTNVCVSERKGANAFTDRSPSIGAFMGNKATSCPGNPVLPLTNDRDRIIDHVNDFVAQGSTAGHLGTSWAWYILSPEWSSVWPIESKPAEYGTPRVSKAVVLMTDGMFNAVYEPGNGTSPEQALRLCENMKAKGIRIFTIGFQPPEAVIPTLKACASSDADFFNADDGAALRTTFREIANRLTVLRLDS